MSAELGRGGKREGEGGAREGRGDWDAHVFVWAQRSAELLTFISTHGEGCRKGGNFRKESVSSE